MKLQRESNRLQLSRRFELHKLVQWKHSERTRTCRQIIFFLLEGKKSSSSRLDIPHHRLQRSKMYKINKIHEEQTWDNKCRLCVECPCSTHCFPWSRNIQLSEVKVSETKGFLMQVWSIFQCNIVTVSAASLISGIYFFPHLNRSAQNQIF